ncbi:alpha/beta fold hydrolase [Duganella sp. HH101]|uniref:alpha/beta hydrolase family protein n=1 Tax=Duganella sp. HH101 TaxID=1781066 RepID=UPI000873F7C9|nr:alpha/beta fold hydrolase [Duganella sp. HH101]OFA02912.1 alpha/beta hydrolase family protein [Duganella sp. HH101]OFA02963.1 alpha/beta hydrolase family protein [Duganella sp. HH101]
MTKQLTLTAADGYPVVATLYPAAGAAKAQLIVASATGVPQGYYRRFAEFAAARGYRVLTLDYRGIGLSSPATLKGFDVDFLDWGRLDLAAAVDYMADTALPLLMIGHSYGGHALGLLPNQHKIAACYLFGTSAGWHGWMPPLERVKVWITWHIAGPLLTRWHGYLAWSKLGMGEDLPLSIYRQWKRWCGFPRYFFDDPRMGDIRSSYDRVRMPVMAVNALDDLWAPPASRDAFMAGYRNASVTTADIDPARAGIGAIGHMGYFRASAQPLWEDALGWLQLQTELSSATKS